MRRPVRARAAFGDWWKPDPIQCPDGQRWDDAESKCVLDKGLIPRFADWIQEHVDFSNKEAGPQWEGHVCPGQSQWDVSARVCVDPLPSDGPPAQPKCPQGMVYQTVDPVGCVPEKADPSRQPPSSASGYGPLVLAVGVAVLAAYLISQQNDADAGLVPYERYLGMDYGLIKARGTLQGNIFNGNTTLGPTGGPAFQGLGDDGASPWEIATSFVEGMIPGGGGFMAESDAAEAATYSDQAQSSGVEDDGSCINLPSSPSGLSCRYGFAPKQRTTNTGKTCFTCAEVPTQGGQPCPPGMIPNPVTKGCSNPSDGGGVPDVVNGKVYCPGGGTPNPKTGICSVVPIGGGGTGPTPKPILPTPAPVVEDASVWSSPLLWGGLLLAAGVGAVVYKKRKAKKLGYR